MGMEFVDRSGQPREDQEIHEAMDFLKKRMIQGYLNDPGLCLQIPVLIDACKEVLAFRDAVRRVTEPTTQAE